MSAQTIARWNSIPMSNPSETNPKRPRDDQDAMDQDDDDDISLVSRTPSPPPANADPESISKYDEYVRGSAREVITVETKIKSSNKGFAMLAKLGWAEGQPLGVSGEGRVDPIPFQIKRDSTGLGRTSQDVRMIESTVGHRRGLDSERLLKETEDQRKAREDDVARKAALQSEISTTLAAFYCSLCSKQFKNVAQYDEHTNSYAHHHKARMKDMAANAKGLKSAGNDAEERKEKERKREEKELRKAAKAAGVKMAKPVVTSVMAPVTPAAAVTEVEPIPSGFKNSGWATVSSLKQAPQPHPGPSQGGWATVSSPVPAPITLADSTASSQTSHPKSSASAPAFRTAGWSTLDTGSSQSPPPPPPPRTQTYSDSLPPPPLPPASFTSPHLTHPPGNITSHALPPAQGFVSSPNWDLPTQPPQTGFGTLSTPSLPQAPPGLWADYQHQLPTPPSPPRPAAHSWQQWKSSSSKRR